MTYLSVEKKIAATLASAVMVFAVGACSSGNSQSGPDSSDAATSSVTVSATPKPETVAPTPNQPASQTSSQIDAGACTPKDVALTISDGEGTAGSTYYRITATNQSGTACTLSRYPTVAFLDANSNQVGTPAQAEDSADATTVTLQPGDQASAVLQIGSAQNYQGCTPVDTSNIGLALTEQSEATLLPLQTQICKEPVAIAYVQPFKSVDDER